MATSFHNKLVKVQSSCLDLADVLTPTVVVFINALADAIGCPVEFIFFPLLTIIASCVGINGTININDTWSEPAIMWFIVAANKGQKKTAALRLLKKPLLEIESELQQQWRVDTAEDKPSTPPQLCIDHFSFEELHNVMRRNNGQVLGLFDEMSTLYSLLDLFKHSGSVMDRKTLITLNGGTSWTRNYRNYSASMPNTAFNISGFIQPAFVEKMLMSDDADGFNDRQLFCFPPQRDVFLGELKLPLPSHLPALRDVYETVRSFHSDKCTYTFTDEGYQQFTVCHDALVTRQSCQSNESIQGILSKARGYIARTAMIIFVLQQAVEHVTTTSTRDTDSAGLHQPSPSPSLSPSPTWSYKVTSSCVEAASTILDYLCKQKMMMMDLKESCADDPQTTQDEEVNSGSRLRKLLLMEMEDGHISPSKVAQKHICAPSNGRYPVSNAFELFDKATSYGFGNIIDVMTPSKRRVKKFRKTPYDCLPPRSLEILRKLKITNDEYQKTFRTTSSIIPTPSLLNDDTDHLPPSDF